MSRQSAFIPGKYDALQCDAHSQLFILLYCIARDICNLLPKIIFEHCVLSSTMTATAGEHWKNASVQKLSSGSAKTKAGATSGIS